MPAYARTKGRELAQKGGRLRKGDLLSKSTGCTDNTSVETPGLDGILSRGGKPLIRNGKWKRQVEASKYDVVEGEGGEGSSPCPGGSLAMASRRASPAWIRTRLAPRLIRWIDHQHTGEGRGRGGGGPGLTAGSGGGRTSSVLARLPAGGRPEARGGRRCECMRCWRGGTDDLAGLRESHGRARGAHARALAHPGTPARAHSEL
jgi:hypothetical protein